DEYIGYIALKIIFKISIPKVEKYIIYDFCDEKSLNPSCIFVKPLIQEKILTQKPSYGKHVFVYQTSSSNIKLIEILKKLNEKFIIYGFDKNVTDGNLIFKRFNESEFYQDIAEAKAVITNGGFTLLSEALYLRKPIFSNPIKNQFEQVLNAKMIEKLGAGVYCKEIKKEYLVKFLSDLEEYKRNLKKYNPGNQKEILGLIEKEILSVVNR
ncbi:MAG TPA: teichoic acid biosynthesis protein, partial [Thermoplasmatales archaeon]|nr:teichoic acid biosynthesis protein [Thermoplasmatales archaeon]HEX08493.1 teichoic acid biosynthesis protein [Thermoplasmatales archaeon]